jgi:hypothetical protein
MDKWISTFGNANIPISKIDQLAEWVHFAAERFAAASTLSSATPGFQYLASMLADSSQLLRSQIQLEKTAASRGWSKGPHKFAGLSLDETLSRLISIGEMAEADSLRVKRKVSDGRYWDLIVSTLCKNCRFDDGIKFVNSSAPPAIDSGGYRTVIEAFIAAGQGQLASQYIQRLKPKRQVEFFRILGMETEARDAESKMKRGGGIFGKLASGFIGGGNRY